MVVNIGSYWNGASLNMDRSERRPTSAAVSPQAEVVSCRDEVNSDTVKLGTVSMDSSQVRLLRVQQLRDSVESGEYHVPSPALAKAMLDKAVIGQDPELSFLPRSNRDEIT